MQFFQSRSDVLKFTTTKNCTSKCILHSLQFAEVRLRHANEQRVAIVKPRADQAAGDGSCDFIRQRLADMTQRTDDLQMSVTCWSNVSFLSRVTPRLLTVDTGGMTAFDTRIAATSSTLSRPRVVVNCITSDFFGLSCRPLICSHA